MTKSGPKKKTFPGAFGTLLGERGGVQPKSQIIERTLLRYNIPPCVVVDQANAASTQRGGGMQLDPSEHAMQKNAKKSVRKYNFQTNSFINLHLELKRKKKASGAEGAGMKMS